MFSDKLKDKIFYNITNDIKSDDDSFLAKDLTVEGKTLTNLEYLASQELEVLFYYLNKDNLTSYLYKKEMPILLTLFNKYNDYFKAEKEYRKFDSKKQELIQKIYSLK